MVHESSQARVPIAQMYTSPGPAYSAPPLIGEKGHDTRSIHQKYPAYSFGVRHGKFKETLGPGPCHYISPNVFRDGQRLAPQYSLSSRSKGMKGMSTPGPADCSRNAMLPQNPAYTFGQRSTYLTRDTIPASNCYGATPPWVQSSKRTAPCFTLHSRHHVDIAGRTPGPCSSIDVNLIKSRLPVYSMTGKNEMPGDNVRKPGPGAHMPNANCIKRCNPAYTFGVRHSDYMTPLIVDLPSIECGTCN